PPRQPPRAAHRQKAEILLHRSLFFFGDLRSLMGHLNIILNAAFGEVYKAYSVFVIGEPTFPRRKATSTHEKENGFVGFFNVKNVIPWEKRSGLVARIFETGVRQFNNCKFLLSISIDV